MFLTNAPNSVFESIINWFGAAFSNFLSGDVNGIIIFLLGIGTLRDFLANTGWFRPDSKFGRVLYGKYDRIILKMALEDLGFRNNTQDEIITSIRAAAQHAKTVTGVTAKDAASKLIILLAKYTVKADDISYGGKTSSVSNYYINTMEMAHNEEDAGIMVAAMIHLMNRKHPNFKKPDVVITPKGGNPLFGREIATRLKSRIIIAKSKEDKSRVEIAGNSRLSFCMNYEGAATEFFEDANIGPQKSRTCILVDCNTSGGTQLTDIIKDIREANLNNSTPANCIGIANPNKAFVLFIVDDKNPGIDGLFNNGKCPLYRFFDLDEEIKTEIYKIRERCLAEGRMPNVNNPVDNQEAKKILKMLKSRKKLHY